MRKILYRSSAIIFIISAILYIILPFDINSCNSQCYTIFCAKASIYQNIIGYICLTTLLIMFVYEYIIKDK